MLCLVTVSYLNLSSQSIVNLDFAQNIQSLPHHALSFATSTLYFVMPVTRSQASIDVLNSSQVDGTNLCMISKDALETLMGNVTSLTKINEEVSSSLKTLTKVLQKQEATCKELATKLDSLNENIVNSSERFADRMDAALTRLGDQFK